MLIKSKKMTALILSLALAFSATTGYAYGTARPEDSGKKERVRPDKKGGGQENLENLSLPTSYPDGEFRGKAQGYSGEIEVLVKVSGGKIVALEVLKQTETPGYYENGAKVIERILEKGDLNVDTITGATITSHAILVAASRALGAEAPKELVVNETKALPPARENVSFGQLKDGTWQGSAFGYKDTLSVEVVIKDGKIKSVSYLSGQDDEPYLSNAKTILQRIVKTQGTQNVDVFTGATYTSLGLINATNQALKKASGTNNKEDSDVESYKLKIKKLDEELSSLKSRVATASFDDGEGQLKDGVYEGASIGYNGEVTVEIRVVGGKLVEAKLKSHTDDKEYIDKTLGLLKEAVKKQGTKDIDTISGATFSSNGILGGLSNALRASRGLEAASAGASGEQIKRLNEDIERLKAQLKNSKAEDEVNGPLKDGNYSGKASGYGGLVEVHISVKDNKITSIVLGSNNEDAEYLDMTRSILDKIEATGTIKGIDTVSGATFSSHGILNATRNALLKASGKEINESEQPELVSKDKLKQLEDEIEYLNSKISSLNKDNAKSAENKADGEYVGFGKGYANRLIKAFVEVKDKKIVNIRLEHTEDRGAYLSEEREKKIIGDIIKNNGTKGVDTISGATLSTSGIIQAVNDALKGGGDGGNSGGLIDSLNKVIEGLKQGMTAIFKDKTDFIWEVAKEESNLPLADGVYTGYGSGWSKSRDQMTDSMLSEQGNPAPFNIVTSIVTIQDGKIVDIKSTEPSSKESRSYFRLASGIHEDIIDNNGVVNVDTVSGATYSSRGILEAVNMALIKARAIGEEKAKNNTTTSSSEELNAMKKELERLQQENEALKQAAENNANNSSEEESTP